MSKLTWTVAEIAKFAAANEVMWLSPSHLDRFTERANEAAAAGRAVPRMTSRFVEPAHVFQARPTRAS